RRVDAVAQAAPIRGAVREDVAEVAVAVPRTHFGALHAVAAIVVFIHAFAADGTGETGPAAAAVEFVAGGEQRFAGDDVDVQAGLVVFVELVCERALGGGILGYAALQRCQTVDGL